MNYFIILPHQLFNLKYYKKEFKYIIYEHPQYFTKYNFNKKKLILHRASMRCFYENMKQKKYKVEYIEYKNNPFNKINNYFIYDPIDKIDLPNKATVLESPNFLIDKILTEKYRKKTDKFFFSSFYTFMKKELNILKDIKSKDKDNRKKLPKGIVVPDIPIKYNKLFVDEAINYINKNFSKNYGNTSNFIFPINELDALDCLNKFIKDRFNLFGNYEDFFNKENDYLYHSVLSSSINIGLINPDDIIKIISKHKNKIPINSYEGYIRQLFWREYQKYCYDYFDFKNLNYFGNTKKLDKKWYNGTVGCEPVDFCIKKAFNLSYLHHIERLMVIGNFMNLYGIKPMEGFKWFMEFAIDSYEWVMHQNVLDMVFFVSGGKTMRRPYISSSNYILKMSYYKKSEWSKKWDKMFHEFIKKNKLKMKKFTYSYPIVKKYL
jgi:deoxyribodipyrimidine photolyase-related protein